MWTSAIVAWRYFVTFLDIEERMVNLNRDWLTQGYFRVKNPAGGSTFTQLVRHRLQ
jgi:hypothetical protein